MNLNLEQGEVLLIDKPLNWTSFDVVNKLRYTLQKNLHKFKELKAGEKPKIKVGHAGTLDPLATGLLIVCIGKETKNIDTYMATEKEYTGTIFIGATRPSYDKETAIDKTYSTLHITPQLIHETATKFTGELQQLPPLHSAIKKDGIRLYEHARAGNTIEVKPRNIFIHSFEITEIQLPIIAFRVTCSKGTYIRALAHDFGKALASGAYLDSLCRTRSGNFLLNDAYQLGDLLDKINFK
ncbi:MAG: tRNA pseudouridine(55) synthase TruB [Bacteroidia bacterium]|nr:tRNA pseudouridine(55) synthase TruB [Bacteroidia bacterium]